MIVSFPRHTWTAGGTIQFLKTGVLVWGYTVEVERRDTRGISRRVGHWRADVRGLDWLHELVSTDLAAQEGDGYPFLFRVRARHAIAVLRSGPPGMNHSPTPSIRLSSLDQIPAGDWLDVKAWDQS